MSHAQRIYSGIATIFMASAVFVFWHPGGQFMQILAGIPLVGSLLAALIQILRDQAAHERTLLIQTVQNRFALGTSSHMANVAFDKHVQFIEEYAQEFYNALTTLFREGPTKEVLQHSSILYALRQKYAVWLTSKVEDDLERFESALRQIGAWAGYVNDAPNAEDRRQKTNEVYLTFAKVMGFPEWDGEQLTDDLAVSMLVGRLRSVLGTEELTALRSAVISKTIADLKSETGQ